MKARRQRMAGTPIRIFTVPEISYEAKDYTELINWQSCNVTEPPLTVNISDVDITSFVQVRNHH